METANQELLFAAQLMARPELVPSLYTAHSGSDQPSDLNRLDNRVARAIVTVLWRDGAVYSTPEAMMSKLRDLGFDDDDGDDVIQVVSLIPGAEDVTIEGLVGLKSAIESASNERFLRRSLLLAGNRISQPGVDTHEALETVERAIRDYRQGSIGLDHSPEGILARMRSGNATTVWKAFAGIPGGALIDSQAPGIDKDGNFSDGIAGQGQVLILSAKYGVGKTRVAFNNIISLLDQGASIDLVVGEDNEASYSVKLMGCKFRIPKWKVERQIVNPTMFLNEYGRDANRQVEDAVDWYLSVRKQLRIYDGEHSKSNIFKFPSAMALLEESKALYGTTHVVVDYVQVWKGETSVLEGYAQELRSFAARTNTGLILLSQIPNEAMKYGVTAGVLPTKGTGDYGQVAHWGYVLTTDPRHGQREMCFTQAKGRDAGLNVFYARFHEESGAIEDIYGTPRLMDLPEDDQPKKGGKRK